MKKNVFFTIAMAKTCYDRDECPQSGYSTDPNDYVVEYVGSLTEMALLTTLYNPDGSVYTVHKDDESPYRQASMAATTSNLGLFYYY